MGSRYYNQLCRAMEEVAANPSSIFLGQSVCAGGTGMFPTFAGVPLSRKIEMPVAEDLQLGISTGLSLGGFLPISVFPRVNFLLCSTGQLVHLDKLADYSRGAYRPKVIIRTAIGSDEPLDPGPQHLGDYLTALCALAKTLAVIVLDHANDIVPAYRQALRRDCSTILIERMEMY